MSIEGGPRHEEPKRFSQLKGFTDAGALGCKYSTVEQYQAAGLTGAEPGKYAYDNGVIAAVTSEGRVCVWNPKADPSEPRAVSEEQAMQALKDAGYTYAGFSVPKM